MERIQQLFQQLTGGLADSVTPLSAAGSNRQYFRVKGCGRTLIGVVGTSREENHAFITLAHYFFQAHLPVPAVLASSDDEMVYLQEDLGDVSLYASIANGREQGGAYSEQEILLLCKTIRLLPRFQFLPVVQPEARAMFRHCYPQQEMDVTSVMFDLNYFKYCFLKLSGTEFNEYKLQQDFEALAQDLLDDTNTFLYRDFQSRNVMLKDGEPYFIDFQGGRKGPVYYDVASFLWQASAKFPDEVRDRLIDEYLTALQPFQALSKAQFLPKLHLFVLFRILQVLGAYGYRGLWEKKPYFIKSIPMALQNLQQEILRGTCEAYPYLKEVCEALCASRFPLVSPQEGKPLPGCNSSLAAVGREPEGPGLVVSVFSFSYKKGIPADESGNGGGYVFDCRSTNNPGRYDEYKPLTGLDQPVIDFLEADGEILRFLDSVYKLVDCHVARYMERGFTHLQVAFGCTGGRHRSVYSAQHVAEHIHQKFGVEVRLCHREQNITQHLL